MPAVAGWCDCARVARSKLHKVMVQGWVICWADVKLSGFGCHDQLLLLNCLQLQWPEEQLWLGAEAARTAGRVGELWALGVFHLQHAQSKRPQHDPQGQTLWDNGCPFLRQLSTDSVATVI